MRLFGGDRLQGIMNTLRLEDDIPIENKLLTSTIESAQSKVESRNFSIRKNVLQFDDVMNQQREVIYQNRDEVLKGGDLKDKILQMVSSSIEANIDLFLSGETQDSWDFVGLREHYMGWLTTSEDFNYAVQELSLIHIYRRKHRRGLRFLFGFHLEFPLRCHHACP